MKRGRTVKKDRVLTDHIVEDVPHFGALTLDLALRGLHVLRVVLLDEALHDERLEQLERHLLGQAALVELELRADDDNGAARIVDALTEEVLTETSLLALEHVRNGLEGTVTGAGDRAASSTIVEEGVHGLLEHALLVVHNDLGRTQLKQALEAGVPVDHATVQVVEIRGREAPTVQLNHGAQIRRDHGDLR